MPESKRRGPFREGVRLDPSQVVDRRGRSSTPEMTELLRRAGGRIPSIAVLRQSRPSAAEVRSRANQILPAFKAKPGAAKRMRPVTAPRIRLGRTARPVLDLKEGGTNRTRTLQAGGYRGNRADRKERLYRRGDARRDKR